MFKIGDKVRFKYESIVGEVLQVRDNVKGLDPKYLIKFKNFRDPDWELGDELVLVGAEQDKKTAGVMQANIDQAANSLEEAWKSWNKIREDDNFRYLQETGQIDIDNFTSVAENFGWSSSSLYC